MKRRGALEGSEYMSIEEVGQQLGVGRARVYQMLARHLIPSVRIAGSVRVPRRAWDRWMAMQVDQALAK